MRGKPASPVLRGRRRSNAPSLPDWRPFFYVFEAAGLTVWLVNATDVKQVSGRPKTDKLDAVWLAKLNERGMLRPSFVPPADIRRLRDYTRLRLDLTRDRTRHKRSFNNSQANVAGCPGASVGNRNSDRRARRRQCVTLQVGPQHQADYTASTTKKGTGVGGQPPPQFSRRRGVPEGRVADRD